MSEQTIATDAKFRKIAQSALYGAVHDPRKDKSDWIRIWATSQQARGLAWDPAAWAHAYRAHLERSHAL